MGSDKASGLKIIASKIQLTCYPKPKFYHLKKSKLRLSVHDATVHYTGNTCEDECGQRLSKQKDLILAKPKARHPNMSVSSFRIAPHLLHLEVRTAYDSLREKLALHQGNLKNKLCTSSANNHL